MRAPTSGSEPGERTEELVARFRAGEVRAFDELVAQHMDRLFALAFELLRSREDAEDVTQEVLIKLHRQLSMSRPPAQLRPWLYRVCLNQCADRRRVRRREPIALQLAETTGQSGALDASTCLAILALRQSLRGALAALPRRQRTAFMLRHFAELSVPEIAAALRCAPATVRVHLSRATRALRDVLSDEVKPDEDM